MKVDSKLVERVRSADAGVPLQTAVVVAGQTCPTGDWIDLYLDVERTASAAALAAIRTDAKELGRDVPAHAARKMQQLDAGVSAARAEIRGRENDQHTWLLRPKGVHANQATSVRLPANSYTARCSAGATHRKSTAKPHKPQDPTALKGAILDSARNAGLISGSKRRRRGSRGAGATPRKRIAKLINRMQTAAQATSAAITAARECQQNETVHKCGHSS